MVVVCNRGRLLLLCLGISLCLSSALAAESENIRLVDLFPFGPGNGDDMLPSGNNAVVTVDLENPIPFYGRLRTSITVYTDGILELTADSGESASIYAFFADADTSELGNVFYRESTNQELLQLSSDLQGVSFGDLSGNFSSLFIATWFYVPYNGGTDRTNTFQCVIGTNGEVTSICLFYPEDLIEWTTGDPDGGTGGLGGDPADVGLVAEDSTASFFLSISNTDEVVDIESTGNLNVSGLWIFRVDQPNVIFPDDENFTSIHLGASGDGSGDGGLDGDMGDMGMCAEAGFTSCCEGPACGVDSNNTCFCDALCFAKGDCCSDVFAIGCCPDIDVGFESSSFTFIEGSSDTTVTIVVAANISQEADFFDPPITTDSFILVYSQDGTAVAPDDYSSVLEVVPITKVCTDITVPVTIQDDSLLENSEFFDLQITTTDEEVDIEIEAARVFILDNEEIAAEFGFDDITYMTDEESRFVEVCVVSDTIVPVGVLSTLISTTSLTAQDGADFTGDTVMINVESGQQRGCVSIPIAEDDVLENQEIFQLALNSQDPRVSINSGAAVAFVFITDSTTLTVNFLQSTYIGSEDEPVNVTVGLSGTIDRAAVGQITLTVVCPPTRPGSSCPASFSTSIAFEENVQNPVVVVDLDVGPDDDVVEGPENFVIALNTFDSSFQPGLGEALVTILDSSTIEAAVAELTYSVQEQEGSVRVCVDISGAMLTRPVLVAVETVNITAFAGVDYERISEDLAFLPGPNMNQQCVDISIFPDAILEGEERFGFTFSDDQNDPAVTISSTASFATISIFDPEDASVPVAIQDELYTVLEASPTIQVCVEATFTDMSQPPVVVTFSTLPSDPPSATVQEDYMGIFERPLVLSPALNPSCVDITINFDGLVEEEETFSVRITSTDPFVQFTRDSAVVTIIDSTSVLAEVGQSTYSVLEPEGEVTTCVQLMGAELDRPVTVEVSTAEIGGSTIAATDPEDYIGFPSFDLVFNPDQELTQCVDIPIVNDTEYEILETFLFQISLVQADTAVQLIPTLSVATVVILDPEDDVIAFGFEQSLYEANEQNGLVMVCVSATFLDDAQGSLTFTLSSTPGTALDPQDYIGITETRTLVPEQPRSCFNFVIIPDDVIELSESFFVSVTSGDPSVQFTSSVAEVLIQDASTVTAVVSEPFFSVEETAMTARACVLLVGNVELDRTVFVSVMTENGSAIAPDDFVSFPSFVLMFTAVGEEQCLDIPINSDFEVEGPEVFTFRISPDQLDQAVEIGVPFVTVITINDDVGDVTVGFVESVYSTSESAGSQDVCVQAVFADPSQRAVMVSLNTESDTAIENVDFVEVSETLTLSPAEPQVCIPITIINPDMAVEYEEVFTVRLTNTDPLVTLATSAAQVFIEDETFVAVSLTENFFNNVLESVGSLNFCGVLAGATLERNVIVNVATQNGTAFSPVDFFLDTNFLQFEPGSPIACADVFIVDDTTLENSEFFLIVIPDEMDQQPDPAVTVSTSNVAVVLIIDPEDSSVQITLEQGFYEVAESDGSVEVCVTAAFPSGAQTSVPFTISTTPGTASDPADFTGISETLTLSPGLVSVCIDITINHPDNLVEDAEVFSVSIFVTNPLVQVIISSAQVTILDSSSAIAAFVDASYSVVEGNLLQVSVQLTGALDRQVNIGLEFNRQSAQGPGNTALSSQLLEFGAGVNPVLTVTISISVDIVVEAGNEIFLATLSSTDPAIGLGQGALVIISDATTVPFELQSPSLVVLETQGMASVCAELSENRILERSVAIRGFTQDGSALAGLDYIAFDESLVFEPGQEAAPNCIDVEIIPDGIQEGSETFSISIDAGDPADPATVIGSPSTTFVTIQEVSAGINVGLQQSVYGVAESDGSVEVCIEANSQFSLTSITISTSPGSAEPGFDYGEIPDPPSLLIGGGILEACADISINPDDLVEGTETFTVIITSGDSTAILSPSSATVFITDSTIPVINVGLEQTEYTATEGQTLEVCILAMSNFQSASIDISTNSVTAVATFDFGAPNPPTVTFGSAMQSACTSIPIFVDEDVETISETFEVVITSTNPAVIISPNTATVTIIDTTVPDDVFISLIGNTPSVSREDNPNFARIDFSFIIGNLVDRVTCQLTGGNNVELGGDCFDPDGTADFFFDGLEFDTQPPFQLDITAFDANSNTLETITRFVRLGFNGDCAVIFVNGIDPITIEDNTATVEFTPVGDGITQLDCRIDSEDVNGDFVNGVFTRCDNGDLSTVQRFEMNLPSGNHRIRVRPEGNCGRLIRRTVEFTIP